MSDILIDEGFIYSDDNDGTGGDDTITSRRRGATIRAHNGDDKIEISAQENVVLGEGGDDSIYVWNNGKHSTLNGGKGNDTINVSTSYITATGGDDNDTIILNGLLESIDHITISGGGGNDTFLITSYPGGYYSAGKTIDAIITDISNGDTIRATEQDEIDVEYEIVGGNVVLNLYSPGKSNITLKGVSDISQISNVVFRAKGETKTLGEIFSSDDNTPTVVETVEPETVTPVVVEPETVTPVVVEPETVTPVVVEPETVTPVVVEPETVTPVVVEPETVTPVVVEPETTIYESDIVWSGTNADDFVCNFINKRVTINTGEGNDTIDNWGDEGIINTGSGNDSILSYSFYETINAGTGDDIITLQSGSYSTVIEYAAGDGNDLIYNLGDTDTINVTGGSYSSVKSGDDIIITVGSGGITLKGDDLDNIAVNGTLSNSGSTNDTVDSGGNEGGTVINNYYYGSVTINNVNNTYTYSSGDKVIENYQQGEVVRLDDYQGLDDISGNSFYIKSQSGRLEIQNSRDKFIGYSAYNSEVIAYSYVASGGGNVDGRGKSQAEILIGADHQNNQIFAGNGGSSLWGGNGGTDTLFGGDGYDEFFFAQGSGGDVIQNAGSNDVVNLLGVSLNQISNVYVSQEQVHINFTNGEFLQVKGNTGVGYRLENQTYVCNQYTGEWSTK